VTRAHRPEIARAENKIGLPAEERYGGPRSGFPPVGRNGGRSAHEVFYSFLFYSLFPFLYFQV
jgi:hypothetical protein